LDLLTAQLLLDPAIDAHRGDAIDVAWARPERETTQHVRRQRAVAGVLRRQRVCRGDNSE